MAEVILIIGVTGYIGFKTLSTALQNGYHVRAVVRKAEQTTKLLSHAQIVPFKSKLEFVVVPNMAKQGAFYEVLDGVKAIIHLASPLAIEDDYDRDIINPALAINSAVLSAASKIPSVRRIVITSSAVTLVPFQWLSNPDSSRVYTSGDLNSDPSGPYSSAMEAYWASKALSRKQIQTFVREEKPHFEIVSLLPSVVIGVDDRATNREELLEGTRALAMSPLLGTVSPYPMVGVPISVADVARAHVDALKSSIPGNAEYILSSDTPDGIEWDTALSIAQTHFPESCGPGEILPLGGSFPTTKWKLDVSSTEKAFGWKAEKFEETMKGLIGQYVSLPNKC